MVGGVRRHREIAYALRDVHVAHIVREALAHSSEDGKSTPAGDSESAV